MVQNTWIGDAHTYIQIRGMHFVNTHVYWMEYMVVPCRCDICICSTD